MLREMVDTGIIEPSKSEWASLIVVLKKTDGGILPCVDYRRLNTVTAADAYPMPRIKDLINRLGQAQYISTLDLLAGPCCQARPSQDDFHDATRTLPVPHHALWLKWSPSGSSNI